MRRILVLLLLSGCANYQPIVDTKGVNMAAYNQDLIECQQFARQVNPAAETAAGAGMGAALGALVGAISGAFLDDAGTGAAIGASLGATGGAADGLNNAATGQMNIVRQCMNGRGYRVLR